MTQPNPRDRSMESTVWSKPLTVFEDFAEELSEHGSIQRASGAIGVSHATGKIFFDIICQQLGPQAQ